MYDAYQDTKQNMIVAQNNLGTYHEIKANLRSNDLSIVHTLPALNAIKGIADLYQQNSVLCRYCMQRIVCMIKQWMRLNRNINSMFLPRIAAYLEAQLVVHKTAILMCYTRC
jgi:hypothetical protein